VETRAVILADPTLNERQKQVLLQIYESFRKENGFEIAAEDAERDTPRGMPQDTAESDHAESDTVVRPARTVDGGTGTARRTGGTGTTDIDPQQTAS
jgi:hypothetical protein